MLPFFGSAFQNVAAGEFLEVVDFVGGFGGGPVEFGGHEGADAGGGGHGGLGIEEEGAAAAGEDVFDGAGHFVAGVEDDFGAGEVEAGVDFAGEFGLPSGEGADLGGVAAVNGEGIVGIEDGGGAVDHEIVGDAVLHAEAADHFGVVDDVFGHAAVGGPFAAGDGDEAGVGDEDGVIAGEGGGGGGAGAVFVLDGDEGAEAGVDAEDVAGLGIAGEVAGGVLHEEGDFIGQGAGLEGGVVDGGVGGADDDAAVPGDGEEDAAVVGLGDHDGGVAGEEVAGEDEVDALAGGDDGFGLGVVHVADGIDEDAGGVDDAVGADFELVAAFHALGFDADDVAVFFLHEAAGAGVIEDDGAVIDGGAGEVDGEAGVVELAVVIDDAAVEALGFEGGEEGDHFLAGEVA